MRARVIGLGSAGCGDDAVGRAVIHKLRGMDVSGELELLESDDASELCWMLETSLPVVIVDALVNLDEPGRIVEVAPESMQTEEPRLFSTHGVDVGNAVRLAHVLLEDNFTPKLSILGITIAETSTTGCELSPRVAAVVPQAAQVVLSLVGVSSCTNQD